MEIISHQRLRKGDRFWGVEEKGTEIRTVYGLDTPIYSGWIKKTKSNIASLYKKKFAEGYSETGISEYKFRFMLARNWADGHRPTYPCWLQYKYNGLRGGGSAEGIFTKNSKGFMIRKMHVPKITNEASILLSWLENYLGQNVILDGEIYKHGMFLQKIVALERSAEEVLIDEMLEYHIFDIAVEGLGFNERTAILDKAFEENCFKKLIRARTELVHNEASLFVFYKKCLKKGYEGTMIRDFSASYAEGKKTTIKMKPIQDKEFKILSIEEGVGKRAGTAARFLLETETGETFTCDYSPTTLAPGKTATDFRKDVFLKREEIVGEMATVQFKDLTMRGIPTEAIIICIRNYEGVEELN